MKYELLPPNHFGERPDHTTLDTLYMLAHKIKDTWQAGKVMVVLFLDIEGAFLNTVLTKLVHNLRKHSILGKYMDFIEKMLADRHTMLKYDSHTSEPIVIDNRIGQGDLLLIVLYQYYNADLLNIPRGKYKNALAYVDDTIMVATIETFTKAHMMLADMMEWEGGVLDWSRTHNSPLEYIKLALIDFTHRGSSKARIALHLS